MGLEVEETQLGIGDFLGGGERPLDQATVHFESGLGRGASDESDDGVQIDQGLTGPVLADGAEEAVFGGIPL